MYSDQFQQLRAQVELIHEIKKSKLNKKFPREMFVSNREGRWIKHTVLAKVNIPGYEGKYATRHPQYEGQIFLWKYGKEIE